MVSSINSDASFQHMLIANLTQSMQDSEQKAEEAQKNLDAQQAQDAQGS